MELSRFSTSIRLTDGSSPKGGATMIFVEGPFEGVKFSINKVALKEENILEFNYDILSNHPQFVSNKLFEKELGDLIVYLLEKPDIKIGHNVPSANSNSPESNS